MQPPELLIHGILSPAVDVYSFGVILWEMWALCHAWQGRTALQVGYHACHDCTTSTFKHAFVSVHHSCESCWPRLVEPHKH